MVNYLFIGLGSALGGVSRYWLSGMLAQRFGESFPLGTLVVNVSGSFLIGFFATLTGADGRLLIGPTARNFSWPESAAATRPSPPSACKP